MLLEFISTAASRLFDRRSVPPIDARIWAELGWIGESAAGIPVNANTALRVATVFACVRLLSDSIAQLPINVLREMPDGTNEPANQLPIATVLRRTPNSWQTSFEWRHMMMGHLCLRGNAYSIIQAGPLGGADQLIPLNPDRMEVQRLEDGQLVYKYTTPTGATETYFQGEILHLRGLSTDGIVGLSPITLARDAIGLSAAMERYGSSLFKNSARPACVIKHPGRLKEEAAIKLRERWEQIHGGSNNAGKTAVLEEGMDVTTLGMTSEDAQFIEARNFQGSEVARIFGVPLHMLADLSRATMNNIEHLSIEFVKFTLGPWLRSWEESFKRDLIGPDELFVKFNVNGLLRGDSAARAAFYKSMFEIGAFSPNDIRELEDMNAVEGGDERFVPLNAVPLSLAHDKAESTITPQAAPAPATTPASPEPGRPAIPAPSENGGSRSQEQLKEIRELSEVIAERMELQRSMKTATDHCLAIMADSASRMIIWEVGAIKRASDKAKFREGALAAFYSDIDAFYAEHTGRFVAAMRCPCDLYASLTGTRMDCEKLVGSHVEHSKRLLLEAAGRSTPKTLGEIVGSMVDSWPVRAAEWTRIGGSNVASSNVE